MAKAMKMADKKDYQERCRKNQTGEYSGGETSDLSKILAIKWDLDHGYFVDASRRKILEEYQKRKDAYNKKIFTEKL